MGAWELWIEAALVLPLGVWMAVAVADNWLRPDLNRESVALVMRMDLLVEEFPDAYRLMAARRIDDPRLIDLAFRAIRWAETAAAAALLSAAVLLALAGLGAASPEAARLWAVLAVVGFVSIWAGFIIGGNWFAYWYCHQWAQSNHFMFMYWGFFVLAILMI